MGIFDPLCRFQGKMQICHFHTPFITTAKTLRGKENRVTTLVDHKADTASPYVSSVELVAGAPPSQASKNGRTHLVLQSSPAFSPSERPQRKQGRGFSTKTFWRRQPVLPSNFREQFVQVFCFL